MALQTSRMPARIRHACVDSFGAELDLSSRSVVISWLRPGKAPMFFAEGTWAPLPEPMGDLRGRLVVDGLHRRTCSMLEQGLARGRRAWSYESGPWVDAQATARGAGVAEHEATAMRKVLWLFYRNRWPLQFAEGCGWGADGYAPLIAAALADPTRARARWELLILTAALQRPHVDGDLEAVAGDALVEDFYAVP